MVNSAIYKDLLAPRYRLLMPKSTIEWVLYQTSSRQNLGIHRGLLGLSHYLMSKFYAFLDQLLQQIHTSMVWSW